MEPFFSCSHTWTSWRTARHNKYLKKFLFNTPNISILFVKEQLFKPVCIMYYSTNLEACYRPLELTWIPNENRIKNSRCCYLLRMLCYCCKLFYHYLCWEELVYHGLHLMSLQVMECRTWIIHILTIYKENFLNGIKLREQIIWWN